MTCAEAREALLVAEVSALEPHGNPSPLGQHLVGCAECRSIASIVVGQTAILGDLIYERTRNRRRVVLRRPILIAGGLAASLMAVGLWLNNDHGAEPSHRSRSPVRHVSVDVNRGQQAAVLSTHDSTVTVIWLSPGD